LPAILKSLNMVNQPRGKAQTYSLADVIEQWEVLKYFHYRLTQISGEDENSRIDEFLDYIEALVKEDTCPPHFLLGVTSTKAEAIRQTWDDLKHECKSKARESDYNYLIKKLRKMHSIEEVVSHVRKIFSNSENAIEKNLSSSQRIFKSAQGKP